MIASIGNSYSYYTGPYASGAVRSAARTAMADRLHGSTGSVPAVESTQKVLPNEQVERIERSPKQMEQDRKEAYEKMTASGSRTAENLNGSFEPAKEVPFTDTKQSEKTEKPSSPEECETCKNRKYVDGSDEGDVSFKTPGHISPENSAAKVMAHEQEHVQNAIQEGSEEGNELVSASVTLKTAVCPECGTTYVAGGETRTTIRHTAETAYRKQQQAFENSAQGKAGGFDQAA